MTRRSAPTRTCAGCAGRAPQGALRRFTAVDGALRLDDGRRAPGRGAYLHPAPACWESFERRRGPIRSLRRAVNRLERARLVAVLAAEEAR